jgi:hypothetical protein
MGTLAGAHMKCLSLCGAVLATLFLAGASLAAKKPIKPELTSQESYMLAAKTVMGLHFDKDRADSGPEGLRFDVAGQTAPPVAWVVQRDFQAVSPPQILVMAGSIDPEAVGLALFERPAFQNGVIDVEVKPISGGAHFAGGVVWRLQDTKNFYILEANSADDTLRLWRWKNGKARCLDEKMTIFTADRWHHLRVVFLFQTYSVYLDDELVMAGTDKSWLAPGAAGIATYGDSVIKFDDLSLKQ